MLEIYLGKEVELVIAFSHSLAGTSPISKNYVGTLLEVDENFIKVKAKIKRETKTIVFSLRYVISVTQL